jgi:ribosomal protein S18 acetylase RimI-like enzyme
LTNPVVAPAQPADANVLARRNIATDASRQVLLARGAGGIVGAVVWSRQAFESEQLGREVGRVERIEGWNSDDRDTFGALAAGAVRAMAAAGIEIASCRLPETSRREIHALESAGFRVVECLLTLGQALPESLPAPVRVGPMRAGEEEACAALAGRVFQYDRFHWDPRIDDSAADRLKRAWILNSARGRADTMLVARDGGEVVGFNACIRSGDTAAIDLIGVAPEARGGGLGKALVEASLAHYAGAAREMIVGTQSKNIASLAMYQRTGFRIRDSHLTFHAHLEPKS